MRRIITGATGLIGQALVAHWSAKHSIIAIGRSQQHIEDIFGKKVQAVTWSHLSPEILQDVDVIVNLAGANLAEKPWSESRKLEFITSRVDTTKKIAELIAESGKPSPIFMSASAIGVYGLQKQSPQGLPRALDEDMPIDWQHPPDFLSRIAREWEQATLPAIERTRVINMRFGVVFTKEGGALPQLVRPFKFFLGATLGSGKQPFSWITLTDLIRAIDFLIEKETVSGPFNLVAPECVTQQQLAKTIGKILHKPVAFKVPAAILKILLGNEMAEQLILEGQHVYPKRLLDFGFEFRYPTLESALTHILRS